MVDVRILRLLMVFILAISPLSAVDFVLFTQPKTGTHLLTPILAELTEKEPYCPRKYMQGHSSRHKNHPNCKFLEEGFPCPNEVVEKIWETNARNGTFLHFHTPYTREIETYLMRKKTVVFFVKRDPRDQIVSLLNHYKKYGFLDKILERITSDDERLFYMIRKSLKSDLLTFKGWLSSPICCVLDFSKLMGAHGGAANEEDAVDEIRKMAEILDLNLSDDQLQEVYKNHFGKGGCFFRGKVGSWRDYFSERHVLAAKKEIGLLLIELGFEKDFDW